MNTISSTGTPDWVTNTNGTPAATPSSSDKLTSEDTFLKLLVAQLKNQDPMSPSDPTQFVGQLTQYSELEQLMQINSGIQTISNASSGQTSDSTQGQN